MNPLDICIVALCAVFALLGLLRGFVRQVASLAGLILGHILAVRYNAWVLKVLKFDFPHAGIVAYLIALLAVYVAVRLIGLLIERWVRDRGLWIGLSGKNQVLGGKVRLATHGILSDFEPEKLPARSLPDKPEAFKQSYDESSNVKLGHTFKLGTGEKSGQFKLHAFMRSSHFAPKHFTTLIEVKTEEARMDELRARDLGDMMDDGTAMMNMRSMLVKKPEICRCMPTFSHSEEVSSLRSASALPASWKP